MPALRHLIPALLAAAGTWLCRRADRVLLHLTRPNAEETRNA